MFKKARRSLKKVFAGESLIKIKYTPEEWDLQYAHGNWDFLLNQHENIALAANILSALAIKTNTPLKVLDIGCGNGALARHLQGSNFYYVGTDISNKAISAAKRNAPNGKFFQSSMDKVPNLSEKFDVIVFCEVLIYGDYDDVLKNYKQYLKEDGYILISLYDVWRTKFIWRKISRQLTYINSVYVKNVSRNVAWNVRLGKYN